MTLHRANQLASGSAIGFAIIALLASMSPNVIVLLACLGIMSLWTAGAVMWGLSRHHEADQPPDPEATPAGPESSSRRPTGRG
jgi:hypothetical protein